MKLWLVEDTGNTGHDLTSAMVIRAETETRARKIAAKEGHWWPDPPTKLDGRVVCNEIPLDADEGVICHDFNAG